MPKLGQEILADVLRDQELDLVVGVAGRPCTTTMELLVESGDAVWANHEAVAVQMALGAAALGRRTAVLMKQVGLNAAVDVLACAALHRSGGSVVVISGDDPGGVYSQTEGDSRLHALSCELPCQDAAGGEDLPACFADAQALSAALRVPAIMRVTTQMMMERRAEPAPAAEAGPPAAPAFDPQPTWRTDALGTRINLHRDVANLADAATVERPGAEDARFRLVATGEPGRIALEASDAPLLLVRRMLPAPLAEIAAFVERDDRPVLVLEDGTELAEGLVRQVFRGQVWGRRTGHVNTAGPLDVPAILAAAAAGEPLAEPEVAFADHDHIADIKPFGSLFEDAVALGIPPIAIDAGHVWGAGFLDGFPAPLGYGLGSAIGVAAGVALATNRPALAATGDFSMYHACILGLLQVAREQIPVITVILDNGRADYTGGQPHPGAPPEHDRQSVVELEELVRGAGIRVVETVDSDDARTDVLRPLLGRLASLGEPSVLIVRDRP
ncbi:MAG: indolepyruvate ferredoxin oxidoreductase, alpha subunit [Thermoleophilaceae bacterium]|jgi:indolepyruvate ferredoxin oxidoreductase alpha subunit|nr:indolepyruvate ferredoxin oxidoreductase, alpha subunit [Thermoleophilaceae bacterium]